MPVSPSVAPLVFTGLIGWAYYRRISTSFGRQPWRPVRAGTRLGLMALLAIMLGLAAVFVPGAALAVGVGALVGGLLGALALKHTHVAVVDGVRGYTPNPWIGGALSLLLIGRLAWRMYRTGGIGSSFAAGQGASPLTLGLAAALITYYLVNGIGLFVQMGRLEAPPLPPPETMPPEA